MSVACFCAFAGIMFTDSLASAAPSAATASTPPAAEHVVTDVVFIDLGEWTHKIAADPTVFRTTWGTHYHRGGCFYLRTSCIALPLSEATAQGLAPCSRCAPPR